MPARLLATSQRRSARPAGWSRRRRWAAAVVVLVLAGTALAAWRELRFDAHRDTMPDAPFDLLVQSEVSDVEVTAVKDGLRLADRHLRGTLRAGVRDRVEVRLARSQGCEPFASPAGPPTGWADARRMCLNTRAPAWRSQLARDPDLIAGVAAHEHVHNVQGQLGCFRSPGEHEWLWLFEGTAVHLAFEALAAGGRWPAAAAGDQMREWGLASADLAALPAFERTGTGIGDPAYALFHLATRYLDEAARQPTALLDFCREVGAGRPWRDAFERAFGLSVEQFYARFAAARPGLIAAL